MLHEKFFTISIGFYCIVSERARAHPLLDILRLFVQKCTAQNWKWGSNPLLHISLNAFLFVGLLLVCFFFVGFDFSITHSFALFIFLWNVFYYGLPTADEAIVLISNLFVLSCSYYLCAFCLKYTCENANVFKSVHLCE